MGFTSSWLYRYPFGLESFVEVWISAFLDLEGEQRGEDGDCKDSDGLGNVWIWIVMVEF
jgi:hypothetical protein